MHSSRFLQRESKGLYSRADLISTKIVHFVISMKLGTWFLDTLRSILRNGAISDVTFGDL